MKKNRNLTINLSPDQYIEYCRLAAVSGISKNLYGKALVRYAVQHELIAIPAPESESKWRDTILTSNDRVPEIDYEIKAGPPLRFFGGGQSLRAAEDPPIVKKNETMAG